MAMAEVTNGGPGGWRYVFEALRNVRCLQLLLFHPDITPTQDCLNFSAVILHGSSLHCAWDSPDGTPISLTLPLPACLLDLSASVRFWIREDLVEVWLGLLSVDPALHMLQLSLEDECSGFNVCRQNVDAKPFTVDFDAKALESIEGARFFCRKCSCKLTDTPFRRVVEVPSMDWREISEHFYGNCCCASFGAQAEVLVAKFQQLLTPAVDTCLMASTTCVVHEENVFASEDGRAFPKRSACQSSESSKHDNILCLNGSSKVTSPADDSFARNGFEHDAKECIKSSESGSKLDHKNSGGEETSVVGRERNEAVGITCGGLSVNPSSEEIAIIEEDSTAVQAKVLDSQIDVSQGENEEPCCSSSCSSKTHVKPIFTEFSVPKESKEAKEASSESLGNGFMTGSGSSEVMDWKPFFCWNCSSLVGSRRGDSNKKSVQFFKCYISTDESILSLRNIFSDHSFERLFMHELEKNTESNASYRYVVRSFQTGAAILQLVLLNQNALVISGMCPPINALNNGDAANDKRNQRTSDRKTVKAPLNAVAKFMFCDCRTLDLEELRLIDKWAQLQKADDIFMLDAVAGTLLDLLRSHQSVYPPSCQSFQQFSLSFLPK